MIKNNKRKKDITLQQIKDQILEYKKLSYEIPNFHMVNTSQSLNNTTKTIFKRVEMEK